VQHLAGDEAATVACQEADRVGDLLDPAEAFHQVGLGHGGDRFGLVDVEAGGGDQARGQAVDPDVHRRPFDRQSLGQMDHPRAGGAGMGDARAAAADHRDDVENRARCPRVPPAARGGLHHVPGAGEVGVDHRVPTLGADVDRRTGELAAGVVDQDVEPSEPGPGGVEQARHRLVVADGQGVGHHLAAVAGEGAAGVRQLAGVAAAQHHARTEPGGPVGDSAADATAGAGDQDYLAVEIAVAQRWAKRGQFVVGAAVG
jgi:hypothetical protein